MKFPIRFFMLLLACFVAVPAHAERVTCPEGLKWTFEGYCMLEFDYKKMGACPQRSKMAKPIATGPLICFAQGTCPDKKEPNSQGICVDPADLPRMAKNPYRKPS